MPTGLNMSMWADMVREALVREAARDLLALTAVGLLLLIVFVLLLRRRYRARQAGRPARLIDEPAHEEEPAAPTPPVADAVAPAPVAPEPPPEPEPRQGRLRSALRRTQEGFVGRLDAILAGGRALDEELYEELEAALITADVGVEMTMRLLDDVRAGVGRKDIHDATTVRAFLKRKIAEVLESVESPLAVTAAPSIIMVTGVNGVGKTTTIGKLAHRFTAEGKTVLLGAADTFRAAAIDQLAQWGERVGCDVIRHQSGADPSAVAFDTVKAARARGVDVALIDTAGRLHTRTPLMQEVQKVKRIIGREYPGAPHEVLLVVDATTGQNAMTQAQTFHEKLDVTGLILTKLDGAAKGGIVVAIADALHLPIRCIGIGEGMHDLRDFIAADFVDALFDRDEDAPA